MKQFFFGGIIAFCFAGIGFLIASLVAGVRPPSKSESFPSRVNTLGAVQEIVTRTGELEHRTENTFRKVLAPAPLRLPFVQRAVSSLTTAGIITETNQERSAAGLSPLKENAFLKEAAFRKANDMLSRQYFEHTAPEGTGSAELIDSVGYAYVTIGENLALGNYANDRDLVSAWMQSPGHRENILHGRFTEIGVAAVRGIFEGMETWIAVQEFGRPLSLCPEVDPAQKADIDARDVVLDGLATDIEAGERVLESEVPGDEASREMIDAYNAKIEEHNALVRRYNALLEELKKISAQYNASVAAFNACIAEE